MKSLAFVLLLVACALPVQADSWLDNSDFSSGLDHWRGNGRSPADMASDNPMDKPDPLLSKGLILPLRGSDWDRIAQDFHGKSARAVLRITYQLGPGVAFSDKLEDYLNVPYQMHYNGWKPFQVPPGTWVIFISDEDSSHGTYYKIKPNMAATGPQTITAKIDGLVPLSDKSLTIAFPPGTGNVVLLNVSMTDN
jgi:hypothetical protein